MQRRDANSLFHRVEDEKSAPGHDKVEYNMECDRRLFPKHLGKDTQQGDSPDTGKDNPSPLVPEFDKAYRGVTSGNKRINGALVKLAETFHNRGTGRKQMVKGAGAV